MEFSLRRAYKADAPRAALLRRFGGGLYNTRVEPAGRDADVALVSVVLSPLLLVVLFINKSRVCLLLLR